ncbi:MAG TPA: hypothetical protein VGO89_01590 [Streptomyces sp.]|jgi:hypothetical protein|nr:hypothetical protein [Streptomyces sp.]
MYIPVRQREDRKKAAEIKESEPVTTAQQGRSTALAVLVVLALVGAGCVTVSMVLGAKHAIAACEGAAVPWGHFALSWAGLVAAALAVSLYAVLRGRGFRSATGTAAPGRAGLVTAVCAGVVLLAGALALYGNYSQAASAELASAPNTLVACTDGGW